MMGKPSVTTLLCRERENERSLNKKNAGNVQCLWWEGVYVAKRTDAVSGGPHESQKVIAWWAGSELDAGIIRIGAPLEQEGAFISSELRFALCCIDDCIDAGWLPFKVETKASITKTSLPSATQLTEGLSLEPTHQGWCAWRCGHTWAVKQPKDPLSKGFSSR